MIAGVVSFNLENVTKLSSLQKDSSEHLMRHTRQLLQFLPLYGGVAAAGLEREGTAAPLGNGNTIAPGAVSGQLFTLEGVLLTGAEIPQLSEVARIFARMGAPADNPYLVAHQQDNDLVALRVTGPSGRPYIVAGMMTSRPPLPRSFGLMIPPDMGFRVGVSIAFIGMACYLLGWWLTRPIRQLRVTAQRLANGDFSVRANVKPHHGDIDELGRDFNFMAEKIETLVSAQQQLVSANKQLVRDISHELRSPLARLNVALGIARSQNRDISQTALDRIEKESERLNFLIGELLTLSLLEGNGDAMAKQVFPLCDLVSEVVRDADFEGMSQGRKAVLTFCQPANVYGNREMLRRSLENIVRNAIRYTHQGTNVEVSLVHENKSEVVIRVRDHGPGVPESALTHIFLPFYRVADDRDRSSGGAGVGLAIVDRTIRLSGGTVHARNAHGGGLEIEIRLPSTS